MGHHFIPRRYLSGFKAARHPDDKPMIWMYDKTTRETKLVSIAKVAQQPEFYTPEDEAALNVDVEIPGNAVIDKIRDGIAMNDDDRAHLTYYISTMIFRVPKTREKAKTFVQPALESTVAEVRTILARHYSEGKLSQAKFDQRMKEIADFEERARTETPDEVIKIMNSPWPFQSALVRLRCMAWRLFRSTGPSYFLTSDNPASYFEDRGLGHMECEMVFPLCSSIILHLSWRSCDDDGLAHTHDQQLFKEFNRRQAFGARRFLFYHENARWIDSVAQISDTRRMNRINWTD